MSTRGGATGSGPEFRWVLAGRRTRLSLVRRLSLSFELRREAGKRQVELWIYAEECIRRWSISARGLGALHGEGGLASELDALPTWAWPDDAPPAWDQGRCVIEASSASRLFDGIEPGPLHVSLQGERLKGEFLLERTPFSLDGRPQWLIRRDDRPHPVERH